MCEIETVLVAAALLSVAGFSKYQVNSEKETGHNSHPKIHNLFDKEYRGFCWNGGEC